tara:strand:- start:219 stop:1028 length:810 start_codon:yes stop_codon:yes gene_type:complete
MKLSYLNKTVNLKIPKTTIRLKQEIIDKLYEEFEPEPIPVYENERFKQQVSKYETEKNLEEVPVKVIGQWISGGADSSLLAYLLCKKIKEENLNVKYQPISVRRGRPWNPVYAAQVLEWIENDLQIDFMLPHEIYYPPLIDSEMTETKIFWEKDNQNFREGKFQILYSGITLNPPKDVDISLNKERNRDDDGTEKPVETRNGLRHYINPFFTINKKWEAEAYKDLGLLDTLFPLTRSCEGSDYETGNYTFHCGGCWWCEERMWAFGRLE